MREVIATGKNVEEAIANGCQALGVEFSDVQFEIIEVNKKTFLGLKTIPAKVRVYLEEQPPAPVKEPEPQPPKQAPQPPAPKPAAPAPQSPAQKRAPAPKAQPQPKPAPAQPQPAEKQPEPAASAPAPAPERPAPKPEEVAAKVEAATAYIRGILDAMGLQDAKLTTELQGDTLRVRLEGESLGVAIGRRGETLDAMQYLAGLAINRVEGAYLRITIDSGNYREKREKTLESLAMKLARSAVKTGKRTVLEPMNPYERRIIHAAVSRVEGACSFSTGEEPNRRVIIAPKNAKPYPPRGEKGERPERPRREHDRGERRGYGKGKGDRDRSRPPRRPRPVEPELPPEDAKRIEEAFLNSPTASEANSKPLYSKIDLKDAGSEE